MCLFQIKAETLILEGDPKDRICQAAEELHVDLVVIGSRGLGTIKRYVPISCICCLDHNAYLIYELSVAYIVLMIKRYLIDQFKKDCRFTLN